MATVYRTDRRLGAAGALVAILLAPAAANAQVTAELFGGTAVNAPTPLTITQTGFPSIRLTADYSVRPLDDIAYFATRLGFWRENAGWVVELLHHKVYLENTTAEVEHFEVTHGYNLITVNRARRHGQNVWLLGGGPVITHSNSTIRGRHRQITAPYSLSGVAIQAAAGRRVPVTRWLFVSLEAKVTAAWARVPIADGRATVPNVAFHVLGGLGGEF